MVQQQVDSLAVYGWLLWWLLSQAQNEYFPFLATSSSTTYRVSQKSDFRMLLRTKKMSATGPKPSMDMTWERLILLSLSKKRPKIIISRHRLVQVQLRRCRPLVIEWVHRGSRSILKVTFWGTPCILGLFLEVRKKWWQLTKDSLCCWVSSFPSI